MWRHMSMPEAVRIIWLPYTSTEEMGIGILHHAIGPCGNTLAFASVPVHLEFVVLSVRKRTFRKPYFPITMIAFGDQGIFLPFLPSAKVTDKHYACSMGSPFTKHPSIFVMMETVIEMSRSKVLERDAALASEGISLVDCVPGTSFNHFRIGFQIRVPPH